MQWIEGESESLPYLLDRFVRELVPVETSLLEEFLREVRPDVAVERFGLRRVVGESEYALMLKVKSEGVRSIQSSAFRSDGGK